MGGARFARDLRSCFVGPRFAGNLRSYFVGPRSAGNLRSYFVGPRSAGNLRVIAAVAFLFGGAPPSLEPDFRVAAPKGWIVEGKQEGSIEWMRFFESTEMAGEDYAGMAITLYRIALDRRPEEAGEALTGEKIEKQSVRRKEAVDRSVSGIRWRGVEADYASESGEPRRETYLYAVRSKKTVYLFWARGPLDRYGVVGPSLEKSLAKVSARLSGEDPEPDGAAAE